MRPILVLAVFPALLLAAILIVIRLFTLPDASDGASWLQIGSSLGILALLALALAGALASKEGSAARTRAQWACLIAAFPALIILSSDYDAWDAAARRDGQTAFALMNTHLPSRREADAVILPRQTDGHYYADASIRGGNVRFLVDTGATVVALTPTDAKAVGINVEGLAYTVTVGTANGEARAAPVLLRTLEIEGVSFRDIPALVMDGGNKSLLGMSALARFDAVEMRNSEMILRH